MKPVIIDAGPIIHLAQINQINLLRQFPSIYIPTSVIAEVSIGGKIEIREISRWTNCKIVSVYRKIIKPIEKNIKPLRLEPAETDVLYLAHQLNPAIILTDDLNARIAAERLNIEVHGSVGVIAYAARAKQISLKEAEESLNSLYEHSSLFVTYAIIENVIQELRKSL